jgi:hypothetical protein
MCFPFETARSATAGDRMIPSFSLAKRGHVTAAFNDSSNQSVQCAGPEVWTGSQDEQDLPDLVDPVIPSKNHAAQQSAN